MNAQKLTKACRDCPFHILGQVSTFNQHDRPRIEKALAELESIRLGFEQNGQTEFLAEWAEAGFVEDENAIREALALADRRIAAARAAA